MITYLSNYALKLFLYQNYVCYKWNWCTPWYEKMLKSQLDTSQKAQAGHATWNYVYTFYYTTLDITWIQAPGSSMKGEILPFNTKYSNYLIVVTTITPKCTRIYASETCNLTMFIFSFFIYRLLGK